MSNIEKSENNAQNNKIIDRIPLLRTQSSPEVEASKRNLHNRGKNRYISSIPHWNSIANPLDLPDSHANDFANSKSSTEYITKSFQSGYDSSNPHNDISAMSVVSFYKSADNLEDQMNTSRDFLETDSNKVVDNELKQFEENALAPNMKAPNHTHLANIKESVCKCEKMTCPHPTIFFRDGLRSVDYVLVWDALEEDAVNPVAYSKRQIFESNLVKEGLEIEYEPQETSGLNFIKIHAPREVLRRYSEILKLRMPMKEELCKQPREYQLNFFGNPSSFFTCKVHQFDFGIFDHYLCAYFSPTNN